MDDMYHSLMTNRYKKYIILGLFGILALISLYIGQYILSEIFGISISTDSLKSIITSFDGRIRYGLVGLLSAAPVVEIIFIIPIAVALDMNPFIVAIVAAIGNLSTVYAIIWLYNLLINRYQYFANIARVDEDETKIKSYWDNYGLPGIAISAPWIMGTRTSTIVALGMGSERRIVFAWMTITVIAWSFIIAFGSYFGIDVITSIL